MALVVKLFLPTQTQKVTIKPTKDIKANEAFKPIHSAINPISGGPSKNPKKEIVETIAMAIPVGNEVELAARLKQRGTTAAVPNPTIKNPKITTQT